MTPLSHVGSEVMRRIRLSRTYQHELEELLEQGIPRFGLAVVEQKRDLVNDTIEQFLARHPRRPVDPVLGIWSYPVTDAPFVLLYDFDDHELRIHLIIHESADRTLIDLATIEW